MAKISKGDETSKGLLDIFGCTSGLFFRVAKSRTPAEQWKKPWLFTVNSGLYYQIIYKVGPLPVINGVITPISRVITPVTQL